MQCDLRISLIAILSVTSVSSLPKDVCDRCVQAEKCNIYTRMSRLEQERWIEKFPCQKSQEQPQQSYFGFSATAKGDYVCCSERIWGIESSRKRVNTSPHYSRNPYYHRKPNLYHKTLNNNQINKNNIGSSQRQTVLPQVTNAYANTHSNLDGQCTVASSFPPDPTTECCGLEATDDDRIIETQNARLYRSFNSSNNDNWPSWIVKPSPVFRGRRKRAAAQKANVVLDDRIAGGKETEFTDFPWTALVKTVFKYPTESTAFNCGGSLISSRYVLSAGHCVYDKNGPLSSVEVYLAEYDKRTFPRDCKYVFGFGEKCIENIAIFAESVILHPQYDDERLINDISLIRLRESAPYTDYIRPICLPPIDIDSPQFTDVRLAVAGWGRNGQYQSDIKQSTFVNLVPQEQCIKFYPDLTREDLCAAGYRGEDTCKGDSGGPLMTVYGGKYYVVGIVSGKRADSPCGTSVPSLYTNVYHYVNWIYSNIRN